MSKRGRNLSELVGQRDHPSHAANAPERPQNRPGRPPGKRSDPNYTQFTTLLHRAFHKAIRDEAHDSERDMSDILAEMFEHRYPNARG